MKKLILVELGHRYTSPILQMSSARLYRLSKFPRHIIYSNAAPVVLGHSCYLGHLPSPPFPSITYYCLTSYTYMYVRYVRAVWMLFYTCLWTSDYVSRRVRSGCCQFARIFFPFLHFFPHSSTVMHATQDLLGFGPYIDHLSSCVLKTQLNIVHLIIGKQ